MSVAKNEHTGDKIQTKVPNKKFRDGWERIYGEKGDICQPDETGTLYVATDPLKAVMIK